MFKKYFEEWCDDSDFSVSIKLTHWKLRFDAGYDYDNSCVQIFWLYINFGPIAFSFAPAHWNQWS